jgi:hypothetical protein
MQCVEHADIAVATNAKHVRDLVGDQIFGDEVAPLARGMSPITVLQLQYAPGTLTISQRIDNIAFRSSWFRA